MSLRTLETPGSQTSTVRADLALLNGMHEEIPLERAAMHRVLRAMVSLIDAGQIPFDEWQQRCLVSAVAFFDREQYRQCARQLDALFKAHRALVMPYMPELPEAAVAMAMRQFAAPGHNIDQAIDAGLA